MVWHHGAYIAWRLHYSELGGRLKSCEEVLDLSSPSMCGLSFFQEGLAGQFLLKKAPVALAGLVFFGWELGTSVSDAQGSRGSRAQRRYSAQVEKRVVKIARKAQG